MSTSLPTLRTLLHRTRIGAAVAVTTVALAATGCGADDESTASSGGSTEPAAVATAVVPASEVEAAVADGATLIDVRTPAEFAAGHLDGALNIDSAAVDFDAQVAELDPEASYVVYCASGNRAGQVIEQLSAEGFTDLVNGGGYEQLVGALG